jgi:pyruvate dehydrogenase E2 component (dihydrolipoamide acetyltransferase)
MTQEFKLPELGENIEAGDIVRVLVAVGDQVKVDQPILELETDKATIEVPSSVSGLIKEVHVKEGQKVAVGQVVLTVDVAESGNNDAPAAAPPQEEKPEPEEAAPAQPGRENGQEAVPAELEFKLPELGENIGAGDVVKVLVAAGDTIEENQPVLELETDKATVEVPSSVSGVIKEVHIGEGETVSVGQLVLTLEGQVAAATKARPAAPAEPKEAEPITKADGKESPQEPLLKPLPDPPKVERTTALTDMLDLDRTAVAAAPNVRRLAREIGVEITQVEGTGPFGRISMEDVKRQARQMRRDGGGAAGPAVPFSAKPLPDFSRWGQVKREPMSNVRRATAEHLSSAWVTIPHVTNFDKADIGELEELRRRFAPKAETAGGKLTITAILLKVVASALKVFPQFNASVDMNNREIVYKDYYHIGIAVDTDRGLLVPSISNVDQKNILELAAELTQISEKARTGKLSLDEMQGSTFTITNLGGIGGTNFTPIINAPEVAILGVSRGQREPVYRDGAFEPRLMLPLSLSYDHRLIDGADAARFLRWLVQTLEEPFMMSLQGW